MPPYDLDIRDASFRRPAATIRISGPDGEVLQTIECPEFTIAPEPLTMDHAAHRAAAAAIVESAPFAAADVAVNVESANPVLALEIRRALERRANRPQQQRTSTRR